jgi:hypothetical protein
MSYNRTVGNALTQLGHDPNKHLPFEGIPAKTIDLVNWRGDPWIKTEVYVQAKNVAQHFGIVQRTRGMCPHCNREFALGNLHQHMKVHTKKG